MVTMTDTLGFPKSDIEIPEQLNGLRVVIRAYQHGDGEALWEAIEESRNTHRRWLNWMDNHHSVYDSEAFAHGAESRWAMREELPMGIWERSTGRFLGGTGFHRIRWDVPAFEIGYWLRSSAQGKGFMTETVKLLCCLAFERLGANRLEIRCDTRNHASAAVPRRVGFIHEATLRHNSRSTGGDLCDTHVFALTPNDYARIREMFDVRL